VGAGEDRFQVEAVEGTESGSDVTVGRGALNLKDVGWGDEGLAFEDAAKGIDLSRRPGREIGESALHHFAIHAGGFAEEDGGRGVAVGDGLDVHGNIMSEITHENKQTMQIYMGTQIAAKIRSNATNHSEMKGLSARSGQRFRKKFGLSDPVQREGAGLSRPGR
jgi:hypothetical protein